MMRDTEALLEGFGQPGNRSRNWKNPGNRFSPRVSRKEECSPAQSLILAHWESFGILISKLVLF